MAMYTSVYSCVVVVVACVLGWWVWWCTTLEFPEDDTNVLNHVGVIIT